jgi:predicted RNA-binding protein with RPS1 domain
MVLEIDEDKRRISLGMKQCKANPWEEFAHEPQAGDKVKGPDQVDHRLRRLHRPGGRHRRPGAPVRPVLERARREAVRNFKKGQEVEAMVLAIDVERERISWASSSSTPIRSPASPRSTTVAPLVNGKVKTVDPRGAEIQLNDDVTGYLRASEISRDRVEDARNVLKEGDEVTVMIINVDRKMRSIQLSIKAKDNADEQQAMQRLSPATSERENAGTTSLGALLRPSWTNRVIGPLCRVPPPRLAGLVATPASGPASAPSGRHLFTRSHDPLRPRHPLAERFRSSRSATPSSPSRPSSTRCRRLGARPPHRDPRLRQLLDQPPPAAHGPQPAQRRAGA